MNEHKYLWDTLKLMWLVDICRIQGYLGNMLNANNLLVNDGWGLTYPECLLMNEQGYTYLEWLMRNVSVMHTQNICWESYGVYDKLNIASITNWNDVRNHCRILTFLVRTCSMIDVTLRAALDLMGQMSEKTLKNCKT